MYSTLSQAVAMVSVENGSVDKWDVNYTSYQEGKVQFIKLFRPFLKIAKECPNRFAEGCTYPGKMKYLSGDNYDVDYNGSQYYRLILSDGSFLWFRINPRCTKDDDGEPDVCAIFWYDVNGNNEPNQLGRDIFLFQIKPFSVKPHYGGDDCYLDANGWGCADFVIKNGNMNYPQTKQ